MAGRGELTGLHRITPEDVGRLREFLAAMPEGDRTFFKEDVEDEATVRRWCHDERSSRFLLTDAGGQALAYLAVIPGVGWSAHVGELRLVVAPTHRRRGIGRALARHGLLEGVRLGLNKLVVEVVADKEADLQMFTSIGFDAEALLKDQIRDRTGRLRDLVLLVHDVDEVEAAMEVAGLHDATGGERTA